MYHLCIFIGPHFSFTFTMREFYNIHMYRNVFRRLCSNVKSIVINSSWGANIATFDKQMLQAMFPVVDISKYSSLDYEKF